MVAALVLGTMSLETSPSPPPILISILPKCLKKGDLLTSLGGGEGHPSGGQVELAGCGRLVRKRLVAATGFQWAHLCSIISGI